MNLEQIRKAALRHLQDADTNILTDIDTFINEAYLEACEEVYPGVPSLFSPDSIALKASQRSVPLPSGSAGKISIVTDSNGYKLTILGTMEELMLKYPKLTETGDPAAIVADKFNINYMPIPSADYNVNVGHYLEPVLLTQDGDIPTHIPVHLHRRILVMGAAAIAFREIDQESEKEGVQTLIYEAAFEDGKQKLQAWIDTRGRIRHNSPSDEEI